MKKTLENEDYKKIQEKMNLIQQEKTEYQRTQLEKAKAEINKIDRDYLKRNKTSTYELNMYRAAKAIFFDTKAALEYITTRIGTEFNRYQENY